MKMTATGTLATKTAQTKKLVERYYEACNRHDIAAALDCLHPECIHYSRLSEYPKEGVVYAFEATYGAFPDLHWNLVNLIAQDDWAAALVFIEGTHLGDYLGHAATAKRVGVYSVDIARVRDGRFIEHRGVLDELHLLAQIGVVPSTFLAQMS
jgi:predicted ester cyclase